jgi:hypothetical protein
VRLDRARLGEHLAALDVLLLDAAEQQPTLSPAWPLVEQLAEHFDAGDGGLRRVVLEADDLDFVAHLRPCRARYGRWPRCRGLRSRTRLRSAIRNGLSTSRTRLRDVRVDRVHQLGDALVAPLGSAGFERRQWPNRVMIGIVVAGEAVLREQLADFHLDEVEQFRVVDEVDLVQEHHDARARRPGGRAGCARGSAASGRRPRATTRIAPSIWAAPVIMFLT